MANLLVIYYSAFGHVFQMAQAVAARLGERVADVAAALQLFQAR